MKKFLFFFLLSLLYATGARAQTSQQSFRLNWQNNANNAEGINIYQDNVKIISVASTIVTSTVTVTGKWGQSFCYQVSAWNHEKADGTGLIQESAKSNTACGTIPVPTQPTPLPPSNNVVTPEPGAIRSSWNDRADNETSQVVSLRSFQPPKIREVSVGADVIELTIEGLRNRRKYCTKVAAIGYGGRSRWSNEDCGTTLR